MLAIILVVLLLAPFLWFIPLRLGLAFRQDAWQARLSLRFLGRERKFNLTEQVRSALVNLRVMWRETGLPDFVPPPKELAKVDWDKIVGAVVPPARSLMRHVRCRNLRLYAEVGLFDAMQTALLTGFAWSLVGLAIGLLRSEVGTAVPDPQIDIRPRFDAAAWRTRLNCILEIRLGHAMVAGVWLLYRAVRSPEVRAWVRNSRRRKGAEGSGREPDSRPDEDGHGEP